MGPANNLMSSCVGRPERPCVRTVVAADVDSHAANLSAWEQHYDQLSAGRFAGSITEFWTQDTQVFLEKTGRAVRQSCKVWKESLWFGIPVRHDGTRMDGREAPDGAILVRPGDASFELVTPDAHEIFGVVVRREALMKFCASLGISANFARLESARWIVLDSAQRRASVLRLQRLFVAMGLNHCINEYTAASRDLEYTVMDLLVPLVRTGEQAASDGTGWARRRQVVARIVDYAQEHPDWVPCIPDLCTQFHLSRRSLQYAFEEALGVSPTVYLRAMRLNGVRRALRTQTAGSVQDAAAAWGFWNLSQFSADYRHFFGERPSDTLHQAERLAPAAQHYLSRHH